MKTLWISGLAPCLALLMSGGILAQEYTFFFRGPGSFTGATGSKHTGEYDLYLQHEGRGAGAQGWQLGVEIENGVALSATVDGTDAQAVFRNEFVRTIIIDPAENNGKQGVISAVVLCDCAGIVLPPNATSSILKIGASFTVGVQNSSAALRVVDGFMLEGFPLDVVIVEEGATVRFTTEHLDVALNVVSAFRRGDCNDDGAVNITDGVCILNWLFLGEATPGCVAVANTNGDDAANITDATYLLGHLFSEGPAPAAPFPDCGPGMLPTDEDSCETLPKNCP